MTPTASLVLPPEPRYLGPSPKYLSSFSCPVCGEGMQDVHTAKVGLSHTEIRSEAKRHVETTGHTVQVELRGPAGLDEFRLATCGAAHCKLAGEVLSAAGEGVCHHHAEYCDSDHAPAKLDADGWCRTCDPIVPTSPQVAAPEAASASVEGGGFESPASISQKREAPGAARAHNPTLGGSTPPPATNPYASLPTEDPRRFSFDLPAEDNPNPFGFGLGSNDRIRSRRGPRVAAGKRG